MRTLRDNHKATIKIRDMNYSINVFKISYLTFFVQLQKYTQLKTAEFIHKSINLFNVALKEIESDYHQCFQSLFIDLLQYCALFETYKFLKVDLLSSLSIDEIIVNLKVGKANYNCEKRWPISNNKDLVYNTVFQLLYLMLHTQLEDETKDSMKLFNAVMFVVFHSEIFKYCTKWVICIVYIKQFKSMIKQKTRLNQ